jgi:uncharacterized protein (UPF0335 family)
MTADKQLKAYIDRVLRLKEEQDTIGDDIREIYAEAKAEGYDKTIMGKLVAHLRRELKQGAGAVAEAESIFDTYLHAYQRASGTPVATHTHAPEAHDPETGEILEDINPRLAKQVVDGMQTEAGRTALIAAVDILIEQEEAGDDPVANVGEGATSTTAAVSIDPASRTDDASERQHSSTVGFADDCRTGGKEQSAAAAAPVGDAGAYAEGIPVSNGSRPADPAGSGGDPGTPSSDASGEKMELGSNHVPGRRDVKSLHSNAESERATNTNSEIDPSEDRKEGHSLDGNADANAGGGHVNAQSEAAQRAGALVKPAPAHKPLRPLCRNPGEHCGGYGSTHCASCIRASKQTEVAA